MVANEHPHRGMSSSIHVGLNSLTEEEKAYGVVISLADLPFLTPETINVLIDEFLAEGVGMLLPVFKNRAGHPVIIDVHRFRERIEQIQGDIGLREIIAKHPEEARKIPWHNDSVIRDIDTPADLERLLSHD
jgi:CTP:molybdopterin cytidylyltransferase MocA